MHISSRPEPLVDQLDRIIDTESVNPMESILLSPVEFAVIQRRIELGEIEGRVIRDGAIGYRQTMIYRNFYTDLPKHPVDQLVAYNMGLMDFVVDLPVEEEEILAEDPEIELEDSEEDDDEDDEYDDEESEDDDDFEDEEYDEDDALDDDEPVYNEDAVYDESQQLFPGGARKAIFGW